MQKSPLRLVNTVQIEKQTTKQNKERNLSAVSDILVNFNFQINKLTKIIRSKE
jgi:hypothetical protein